jgi:hypothetical protein
MINKIKKSKTAIEVDMFEMATLDGEVLKKIELITKIKETEILEILDDIIYRQLLVEPKLDMMLIKLTIDDVLMNIQVYKVEDAWLLMDFDKEFTNDDNLDILNYGANQEDKGKLANMLFNSKDNQYPILMSPELIKSKLKKYDINQEKISAWLNKEPINQLK